MDIITQSKRTGNRGLFRAVICITTIICVFTTLASCSAGSNAVNKALNESDAVSALVSDVRAAIRDNLLQNGTKSEREQYQGLFDAIPKSDFAVLEPYIIFSDKNYQMGNKNKSKYYLLKTSGENAAGGITVEGAKMLIYAIPTFASQQLYNKTSGQGQNMGATGVYSYSMNIYYYDVEKQSITGFEKISAPPFPDKVSGSTAGVRPSNDEAIAAVETRAASK